MVDPTFVQGGPGPVERPAQKTGTPESAPVRSPAFQALLEKLEDEARQLEQAGRSALKPEELAGAALRARHSLSDALSLGDQLLEAYRAAQLEPEEGGSAS